MVRHRGDGEGEGEGAMRRRGGREGRGREMVREGERAAGGGRERLPRSPSPRWSARGVGDVGWGFAWLDTEGALSSEKETFGEREGRWVGLRLAG